MKPVEALAQALLAVLGYGEVSTMDGSTGTEKVAPMLLAALPEGSALVTTETLAEAMLAVDDDDPDAFGDIAHDDDAVATLAAAIIEALRRE